jgi:hypothetical protein
MVALRTPIGRPPRQKFSDEALRIFERMLRLRKCTCPPRSPDLPYFEEGARCRNCQKREELLGKLYHAWPNVRPWYYPVVIPPGSACPYEHHQGAARIFREAQARWTEIEAALAERARLARSRQP